MLFSSCKFKQFNNACTQRHKKKQQRLHKANTRVFTTRSYAVLSRSYTGDRRELELNSCESTIQPKDTSLQLQIQDAKRLRKIYRQWVLFYAVLVDNLLARHHWERSSLAVRWSNATRLFSRYFLRLLLKNAKKWRKCDRNATLCLTTSERSSRGQKKSPRRG